MSAATRTLGTRGAAALLLGAGWGCTPQGCPAGPPRVSGAELPQGTAPFGLCLRRGALPRPRCRPGVPTAPHREAPVSCLESPRKPRSSAASRPEAVDRRRALVSEPGFRVACALCPLCWPAVTRWPRRISRLERDGRPAGQCPTAWLWRGDGHWGCSLHGARGAPGPALPQGCCALFHPLGSRGRVGPEEGGLQLQSSPGPTHGVPPPEQGVRGVRHAVAVGTRRLCPEIADCWGWGRGPPAACPRSLAFPCPPQGGSVPWDCGPVPWPRPCGLGCPLALGVLFSCARALGGFTTGPASLVEPGDPQDRGAPPSLRAPVVRASPTQSCGSFGVLVGAALGELAALFARSFPSVRHVPGLAADTCGTRSQALGSSRAQDVPCCSYASDPRG